MSELKEIREKILVNIKEVVRENKEKVEEMYEEIYANENKVKFVETFFSDRKMIRTFPNLKATDINGNILFFIASINVLHNASISFLSEEKRDFFSERVNFLRENASLGVKVTDTVFF